MRGLGYGVLLGAVCVGAAWCVTSPGEPVAARSDGTEPSLSAEVGQLEVLDRLDRIERRLDAIAAAPPDGPTLAGRPAAPDAESGSDPGMAAPRPVITDEVLEKTIERMEEKKYAKFTPAELQAEARRLMNRERDLHGAKAMLERLLERDLEPKARTEALTDLGAVYRGMSDYDASEKTLKEAIRTGGEDTMEGVKAGYHLIWTYRKAERTDQALATADRVLRWSGVNDEMRPWVRWAGARMAFDSGDRRRAAADYRALISDVKDNPAYKQIIRDATARLKEME